MWTPGRQGITNVSGDSDFYSIFASAGGVLLVVLSSTVEMAATESGKLRFKL